MEGVVDWSIENSEKAEQDMQEHADHCFLENNRLEYGGVDKLHQGSWVGRNLPIIVRILQFEFFNIHSLDNFILSGKPEQTLSRCQNSYEGCHSIYHIFISRCLGFDVDLVPVAVISVASKANDVEEEANSPDDGSVIPEHFGGCDFIEERTFDVEIVIIFDHDQNLRDVLHHFMEDHFTVEVIEKLLDDEFFDIHQFRKLLK